MTTFAQFLYINANPDKSHSFEDNEDFEQFRDNILLMPGMTLEKVDRDIETPFTKTRDSKLTFDTILRRSYGLIRDEIAEGTNINDVQRFLVHKLYEISLQLGEIENEKFKLKWEELVEPHLKNLSDTERYRCLDAMKTKLKTISGKDSKTWKTFVRAKKSQVEELVGQDLEDESFRIPK